MKSRMWRSLLGGVALMVGATGIAAAAESGLPGNGWYTTAVIQNLSAASEADVVLSAYDAGSTSSAALSASTKIAANSSVTFRPDSPGTSGTVGISNLGNGFFGSMIISSLESLAAVASISNVPLGGTATAPTLGIVGGLATANYQGASEGQTRLSYPAVKLKFGGFTTALYIQSVGADGTFTATVKTAAPDSKTYSAVFNVAANRTTVIPVSTLKLDGTGATWGSQPGPTAGCTGAFNSASGSPCFGAITVDSSTPVVGTAVEFQSSVTPGTRILSASMLTSSQAGDKIYCPVYKNTFTGGQSGKPTTGVTIQNVGAVSTTVSISIKGNATPTAPTNAASGQTYTPPSITLDAGASAVVSPFAKNDGNVPASSIAAMTISAPGGSIVAIANEVSSSAGTAHACFSAANASNIVALPLFKKAFPSATAASAANSGAVIQNISADKTANVAATFTCRKAGQTTTTDATRNLSLTPGSAATIFRNNPNDTGGTVIPDNTICAVRVTATNTDNTNGTIVAIVNETTEALSIVQRDSSNYEGFPQ